MMKMIIYGDRLKILREGKTRKALSKLVETGYWTSRKEWSRKTLEERLEKRFKDFYAQFNKINSLSSEIKSKLDRNLFTVEVLLNEFPIDDFTEFTQVLGSGISVVDIVGMFPNVNGQHRLIVAQEGVSSI